MSTDTTPPFVPDGYQLEQRLGSGQTAVVYLATHPRRGEVALKLPRPEIAVQPVLRRMFENEVQITLSLEHDNIVVAFEGFPTGPKAFLALEYCAGGTLDRRLLEGGRMEISEGARVVLDVAQGLEHSHTRKVLHRDIKPANVFLTADGQAKLGDFGTGLFMAETTSDRVGTAFYMAPEIFEGAPASVRSDVYALGILAYEVLAGTRPFTGESVEDLMMAHLSRVPRSLRSHRPELPRGVDQVVATAMSRDPSKRFASVREFRQAFTTAAGVEDAPLVTGRAGRRREEEPREERASRGGLFGFLRRKKG